MPTIIMSRLAGKLDGSIKARTLTFLEKLSVDDTVPGLHVEPITGSADDRVRTGRIDQFWRAVLFRLDAGGQTHYVFHGVWPHDEAIRVARTSVLRVNPVNGLPQIEPAAPDVPTPLVDPVAARAAAPVDVVPAAEPTLFDKLGVVRQDLVDRLGLPQDVAAAALAAPDADAMLDLASTHEGWAGLMLIDLATGTTVDEVVARYELQPADGEAADGEPGTSGSVTGSNDVGLLDAFKRPAAQAAFTFVADQQELRRVIEGGDFGAWRVFLHPEQRNYVTGTYRGPYRISGGAGTGKTVVLVHRARRLARQDPDARIVLTTFTRNLADALGESLTQLDPSLEPVPTVGEPGVAVCGVDALAAFVLRRAGHHLPAAVEAVLGEPLADLSGRVPAGRWRELVDSTSTNLPDSIANETFLATEYACVVLPQRIHTREEYLRVRRPGRGVSLDRTKRNAVWDLVEAYRARNRVDAMVDYAEAAAVAAACLTPERLGPLVDHVLVDEGQDLLAPHWQLLRAVVHQGTDDLFLAEDSYQRIYGSRLVLSRLGIAVVGRSRRLTLNYRTTAQTLHHAMTRLQGGATFTDLDDRPEQTGYRSARHGPDPDITHEPDALRRLDRAAKTLRSWLDNATIHTAPETIAVLVRDTFQRDRFVAAMNERGVGVRAVDRSTPAAGKPLVMTMHRAKGMEFSHALLFAVDLVSDAELARVHRLDPTDQAEAEQRRRCLEYVAATRARDQLAAIYATG
jgi:superfamily I DNA/RNA helicase